MKAVLATCLSTLSLLAACGGGGSADPADNTGGGERAVLDPLVARQWALGPADRSDRADGHLGVGALAASTALGVSGQGLRLALIDSALDTTHPDLRNRWLADASHSYLSGRGLDPAAATGTPADNTAGGANDARGTVLAGLMVAEAGNGLGGQGAAPQARLMAYNAVATGQVADLADALARALSARADVVTLGAVPTQLLGNTATYLGTDASTWRQSLSQAVTNGRGGKGTVVLVPAGADSAAVSDGNRNPLVNAAETLAVGAVDALGRPLANSTPGAQVLLAAPAGTAGAGLLATDIAGSRGLDTGDHSDALPDPASAPALVAAVVALMLETNPALGWRDVRWLLAQTAEPAAGASPAASPMNSHGYDNRVGFGRVNALRAVLAAKTFAGLGTARTCHNDLTTLNLAIPDNNANGLLLDFEAGGCGLQKVETVRLDLNVAHGYSGDLQIELISPGGAVSLLALPHQCPNRQCTSLAGSNSPLRAGWTFTSLRHLGENAAGTWRVRVSDRQSGDSGTLVRWQLTLQGH